MPRSPYFCSFSISHMQNEKWLEWTASWRCCKSRWDLCLCECGEEEKMAIFFIWEVNICIWDRIGSVTIEGDAVSWDGLTSLIRPGMDGGGTKSKETPGWPNWRRGARLVTQNTYTHIRPSGEKKQGSKSGTRRCAGSTRTLPTHTHKVNMRANGWRLTGSLWNDWMVLRDN